MTKFGADHVNNVHEEKQKMCTECYKKLTRQDKHVGHINEIHKKDISVNSVTTKIKSGET